MTHRKGTEPMVDVLTRSGFDEIASSHGIRAAWDAKVARLTAICADLPGNSYGIYQGGRFRQLEDAKFERSWLDHPKNTESEGR